METFLPLRAVFPVNFVEIVAKRKTVADGVLCACVCVCVCVVCMVVCVHVQLRMISQLLLKATPNINNNSKTTSLHVYIAIKQH